MPGKSQESEKGGRCYRHRVKTEHNKAQEKGGSGGKSPMQPETLGEGGQTDTRPAKVPG